MVAVNAGVSTKRISIYANGVVGASRRRRGGSLIMTAKVPSIATGSTAPRAVEQALGRDEAAIETWSRIESQNPEYLPLVAERLSEGYRRLGRIDAGLTLLKGYLARYPSIDLLNVAFQAELETAGSDSAYRLVREELRRNPTLLGLDKLLEAQLLEVPASRRHDLELVKDLVHQHTRSLAMYRCDHCGFRARQFYWHCPACNSWESYAPRRTEEKELPK
jgi:lipopolysaccharide biosynthesis regulator YciM